MVTAFAVITNTMTALAAVAGNRQWQARHQSDKNVICR